jgi:hypothetical protein
MVQMRLDKYLNVKKEDMWEKIAEHEEFDYLIRASQRIFKPAETKTKIGQ